MRSAYRLLVCLLLVTVLLNASVVAEDLISIPGNKARNLIPFSEWSPNYFASESYSRSKTSRSFAGMSTTYSLDTIFTLHDEVRNRLGIRYRYSGSDKNGYDCSGFVWRVFYDAGIKFNRGTARTLWAKFPEATEDERAQFGTLVFFNRLKHVGIVRDAYSFYHASRSKGVVRSYFSGYWNKRIVGYRRALVPIDAQNQWRLRVNPQVGWKERQDLRSMQGIIQQNAKLWQAIIMEVILPQITR